MVLAFFFKKKIFLDSNQPNEEETCATDDELFAKVLAARSVTKFFIFSGINQCL